jgi:hypothetical protein
MSQPEPDWVPVRVLPNIELNHSIECELAALAPRHDPRVKALCKALPRLRKFLGRFTDAFGQRLQPAVLLVCGDAPKGIFTVEAVASFRDAVALSTIPYNRAWELRHPGGHRIRFANAFWFYPWMLDRFNEDLIASTPAMLGPHEVDAFKDQSSPEIPHHTLSRYDLDQPLLDALLRRWQKRYVASPPDWADRALFRSLNMANQAALMPAGSDTTFYDVGRSIALWVSAFEILGHPGIGKSGLAAVYGLLDQVKWQEKACALRRYKAYMPGRNAKNRRTLACWLYGEIYDVRNQFLHGNAITPERLIIKRAKRSLFLYTAPLYRMALTGFLPVARPASRPSFGEVQALAAYLAAEMEFYDYQDVIERGLLTALNKNTCDRRR